MASIATEPGITAADVARGVCRLLYRAGAVGMCEVPLGNGRRADILALTRSGELTIIEIKVSAADLRGDAKWRDYLDYCDRFYWAVPPHLPRACFEEDAFGAGRAGLILADRHEAVVLTEAAHVALAGARRRAELLRFARRAAERLLIHADPELAREAAL